MHLFLQDTAELFFEDMRLPPSALLGKANDGFYYLMEKLPQVYVKSLFCTTLSESPDGKMYGSKWRKG